MDTYSSVYKHKEEFESDAKTALELINNNENIPNELYEKLRMTALEKGLIDR